jgi:hypothetical protein
MLRYLGYDRCQMDPTSGKCTGGCAVQVPVPPRPTKTGTMVPFSREGVYTEEISIYAYHNAPTMLDGQWSWVQMGLRARLLSVPPSDSPRGDIRRSWWNPARPPAWMFIHFSQGSVQDSDDEQELSGIYTAEMFVDGRARLARARITEEHADRLRNRGMAGCPGTVSGPGRREV